LKDLRVKPFLHGCLRLPPIANVVYVWGKGGGAFESLYLDGSLAPGEYP